MEVNVLIFGELGMGKEVVVCNIYYYLGCCNGFFVFINCGVILVELLESELFGYEKGVFIGVIIVCKGCFELVEGGIFFLDEIGDMLMSM